MVEQLPALWRACCTGLAAGVCACAVRVAGTCVRVCARAGTACLEVGGHALQPLAQSRSSRAGLGSHPAGERDTTTATSPITAVRTVRAIKACKRRFPPSPSLSSPTPQPRQQPPLLLPTSCRCCRCCTGA